MAGKVVRIANEEGEVELDTQARVQRVKLPSGGMIIRAFDAPIGSQPEDDEETKAKKADFYRNLAEDIDESTLGLVSADLYTAIELDWQTANQRREDISKALKLLAIRVEEPRAAPVEGQSVVRSPLLLEALLAFQSNAAAELLPASGPVKMRYDGDAGESDETLALTEDLERDFNHYLTTTASEYYPDTTRMLFDHVGLAGAGFKKIFRCPLRERPVSESVASEDLIVNAGATDLGNAQRITQRLMMTQATMRRLQLNEHYRDIVLTTPTENPTPLDADKARTQGLGATPQVPNNHRYTLYECYTDYDLPGFKHKKARKETGLPLPYRITIDTTSRKILEIRRDWKEDDEQQKRKKTFVKWPFVEALGFYGIGLMHILGNTTEAMTAAWRLLLDAGMFSNFPGFLYAKDATKGQETNVIRIAPGTGKGIQTGGKAIGDIIMPLPYKGPDQAFIALAKLITEAAQKVGGTPQLPTGEGRQDAPVGTTIALLEQATKMMASVHKGLHGAQAEEFQLLKELFREEPEAFWRYAKKKRAAKWNVERFVQALNDNDIVPSADPNTPSHMHRIMRSVGLIQLATAFPELMNLREALKIAVDVLGWDPDVVLNPPPEEQEPKEPEKLPIDQVGMAAVEAKKQGDQINAQVKIAEMKSKETIAGAQIRQRAQSDQAKIIAEREKQTMLAKVAAMKALGLGSRVI